MGSRGSASGANTGSAFGVKSGAVAAEIRNLAKAYLSDSVNDADMQDILEGFEITQGENYENMNRYFNSLVDKMNENPNIAKLTKELKANTPKFERAKQEAEFSTNPSTKFNTLLRERRDIQGKIKSLTKQSNKIMTDAVRDAIRASQEKEY